jgi:TniQ
MDRSADSVGFATMGEPGELLVRPGIVDDEWWEAYVVRVLQANGVEVTREYLQRTLEARVLRLASEEVAVRHQVGHEGGGRRVKFGVHLLPRWAVRGTFSAAMACLACVDGAPLFPMRWRLRGVTCCSRHGVDLLAACPTCEKRVLLWDVARRRCSCGAALDTRHLSKAQTWR